MRKSYLPVWLGVLLLAISAPAGTPVIDGSFDGESVWGTPVATADGVAGWSSVNVDKIYVTYNETYAYFAAVFVTDGYPAGWMRVAFAINVRADGGWNDPWGQAVSYVYTPDDQKPDFVPIGRLQDNWAELREWNGSEWLGAGTNIFDTEMEWATDYSYVECRVSRATLGNPQTCDVQFYVSGDNDTEHGVFDACPDDQVMQSWNDPTELDNYALDVQIGSVSAIDNNEPVPEKPFLAQNYPNPFNPTTTISYKLTTASRVKLIMYDILGRTVKTLVDKPQAAGLYKVKVDAADLPSGVYFYHLQAGAFSSMRKMVLTR